MANPGVAMIGIKYDEIPQLHVAGAVFRDQLSHVTQIRLLVNEAGSNLPKTWVRVPRHRSVAVSQRNSLIEYTPSWPPSALGQVLDIEIKSKLFGVNRQSINSSHLIGLGVRK